MRFFEEIADRESRNENEIVLYPEGLFYKAYDRSAFACVNRIPTFKPSKKRIKYCAREVASIGFPASALPKYFPTAPRPLPDGRVVIRLKDRIDADACNLWKSSLPLRERRPRGSSKLRAYLPLAGRDGRTGNLFVHPADLLPDAPVAFSTGTTGPEQPVRTTGGRGAAEQPEPQAAGPTTGPMTALHEGPERANSTTGGKGGEERRAPGTRSAEEVPRVLEPRRPKWLVRLACKMLGIRELSEIPARAATSATGEGLKPAGEAPRTAEAPPAHVSEPEATRERGAGPASEWEPERAEVRREAEAARRTESAEAPASEMLRRETGRETGPRRETREERAVRLIREFRLEASTPVECLLFVADLKKEIDGYL